MIQQLKDQIRMYFQSQGVDLFQESHWKSIPIEIESKLRKKTFDKKYFLLCISKSTLVICMYVLCIRILRS
jgi:hypothetical protein